MSGKLIMKRKLDKELSQLQPYQDTTGKELPATTNSPQYVQNNNDESSSDSRASSSNESLSKRFRCDTPPPEPEIDNDLLPPLLHEANFIDNHRNRHLLEAIQLKVLELQQELDEFEQDFGVNEEDFYNVPVQQEAEMSEQEAEALGYAMCAQETMLFLQREGVPANSILYTRLRDALVGLGEQDRAFHI